MKDINQGLVPCPELCLDVPDGGDLLNLMDDDNWDSIPALFKFLFFFKRHYPGYSDDGHTTPQPKRKRKLATNIFNTEMDIKQQKFLPCLEIITISRKTLRSVMHTIKLPPFIRMDHTAAAPAFILVNGAPAPVQPSASPSGSLSDISPVCTSPQAGATVKAYIQERKAYMNQACEDLGDGLTLSSNYVDSKVIQRDPVPSGKNSNKSLDKELNVMEKQTERIRLHLPFGRQTSHHNRTKYNLETLLLHLSTFASSCSNPDAVFAQILAAPKRTLIIFDGFEDLREFELLIQPLEKEVASCFQKDKNTNTFTIRQLYSAILQRLLLPGCCLLLSSRPRGSASQLLRKVDNILEISGFSPSDIETMNCFQKCSYLNLLCWNPGICQLVCALLEQKTNLDDFPRTLTAICFQVLRLKMNSLNDEKTLISKESVEEVCVDDACQTRSKSQKCARKKVRRKCDTKKSNQQENGLMSELSCLAWETVKVNSSVITVNFPYRVKLGHPAFVKNLSLQTGAKGRRRQQREEFELTQRFAVGLLFQNQDDIFWLHPVNNLNKTLVTKQKALLDHLKYLQFLHLRPSQILDLCHFVYEGSFTHNAEDSSASHLTGFVVKNLPEKLTFNGVPLSPADAHVIKHIVGLGATKEKSFSLDVQDCGILVSGLRALVGLDGVRTYRACIADVIVLWEELEKEKEDGHLRDAVSKFKIDPFKATQVSHIEHLAKLVDIHTNKRLSESQLNSIFAEGVPAVEDLHKLELELGPEKGPLALPMLWKMLPGLHNLQHLDLENNQIGDNGAQHLAKALVSLCSLETINLSQNTIGDTGAKLLSATLRNLPRLDRLSLHSNVIGDEGANSFAAVLPHMCALTELDIRYNKLTDVGAQSLGISLKNCQHMKSLRMWSQCITYGVIARLHQQDQRITDIF
ncbi:hypothetical protein WMY93_003198 [Mugilogobius chulae]|uniref:NACHT domain-containing protein n=1 Tax=Mugilogobius chulae TaxID=88201 RepID=A0AAW0PZ85_9GOBI